MRTKYLTCIGLIVLLSVVILLNGCSDIQGALETKQQKCEKERAHCKAECNKLTDIFGCSNKCDKHYEACII